MSSFAPNRGSTASLRHYFGTNTPKEQARIMEESFARLRLKPGEPGPLDKAHELSRLIANRITSHMPWTRDRTEQASLRSLRTLGGMCVRGSRSPHPNVS